MRGLLVAVGFLTRIPVPVPVTEARHLARAVPWFPAVGAGIGAVIGLILAWTSDYFPPLGAATLAVAAGMLLTGALHEDGLADTFDGLTGRRSRDEALRILSDPRLGTYGAAALFATLLLRVVLLSELVGRQPVLTLVAVHALSRGLAVGALMGVSPVAGSTLGAAYAAELRPSQPLIALVLGTAVPVVIWASFALPVIVVSTVGVVVVVGWARRRIGGVTGDVLGACQQVAELAALGLIVAAGG